MEARAQTRGPSGITAGLAARQGWCSALRHGLLARCLHTVGKPSPPHTFSVSARLAPKVIKMANARLKQLEEGQARVSGGH